MELPSGHYIPAGVKLGKPSGAPGFRQSAYGSDVIRFKTEGWLQRPGESEDAYIDQKKRIEQSSLTFGYGSRVCIGKNIANMTIYKAVATIVGLFEFELVGNPTPFQVM